MASGLPVVAFDYAAAGRLVQPQINGLLAPFGNASEFVRMAVDLAQDREGLRVMGRHARTATETLGWDRIIDSLESIYHGLVQAAPAPRAGASGTGWRAQGA
jgi:glycosyltransferase involved in cell wall biosynthesis